jgi:hypothetical protein
MIRNMPMWERGARVVLGVLILGLYGALDAPEKYLTLLGLIPLGTGLLGRCPVYTMPGINRCAPSP